MRYPAVFLISLLTILSSWSAAAPSSQSAAPQGSAVSEKEIESFLSFYRSISELEVSFQQEKKIKEMSTPIKSKGVLKIQKPDKVIWSITEPSPVTVSMNAAEIRIESGRGEDKVTQVFKKEDMGQGKETQSLRALSSWMQMDTALLAREYLVTKLGERQYVFAPKSLEASPFEKIRVTMSVKKHIQSLTLFEKSGDLLEITFAEPKVKIKK